MFVHCQQHRVYCICQQCGNCDVLMNDTKSSLTNVRRLYCLLLLRVQAQLFTGSRIKSVT